MKRGWKIILVVFAIAVAATWMLRTSVAEKIVMAALQKRQFPIQSLHVVTLTKNHIVLRDVALGENGEIKAAHADIFLEWHGTNVAAITMDIQGSDITAMMGADGFKIGGVERAWSSKNAALNVATKPNAETQIKFAGDIKINYAMSGDIRIELLQHNVQVSQQEKTMLLPLNVNGIIEGNLAKSIEVKITFASAKNELTGDLSGHYEPLEKAGKFTWKTQPMNLAPDGITFAQMSPLFAAQAKTFPMQASSCGTIVLSNNRWVATPTISLLKMPLTNLLASALGEGASVDGIIGGMLPIEVTPDGWIIKPATMKNIGGLHIAVQPGSTSATALSSHPQANIVQAALANFQVQQMTLDLASTDHHGGIKMQWHFVGNNPDLLGGKKVDFTLAVTANLEDMLRATASAESLVNQAKK
jgi:hypothetical protein